MLQRIIDMSNQLWRPVTCWSLAFGVTVNCIIVPIWKGTGVDLTQFAALVAAFAPLAALRTYEKLKDPNDPLGTEPKQDQDS